MGFPGLVGGLTGPGRGPGSRLAKLPAILPCPLKPSAWTPAAARQTPRTKNVNDTQRTFVRFELLLPLKVAQAGLWPPSRRAPNVSNGAISYRRIFSAPIDSKTVSVVVRAISTAVDVSAY